MYKPFKFVLFLFLLSVATCSKPINQYDEYGEKDGLWVEEDGSRRNEIMYKNGVLDGVCRHYQQNVLTEAEFYSEGELDTLWIYDKTGVIEMTNFEEGVFEVPHVHHWEIKSLNNRCYVRSFLPNGSVEFEGVLLFEDDPESDTTCESGEWKYYNEDGSLKETKFFE